jgi:hypothetical protein
MAIAEETASAVRAAAPTSATAGPATRLEPKSVPTASFPSVDGHEASREACCAD